MNGRIILFILALAGYDALIDEYEYIYYQVVSPFSLDKYTLLGTNVC